MSGIEIKKLDNNSTCFTLKNGSLAVLIRHGDISQEVCDAIVNSTNQYMNPNGGVDRLIHEKMGQFYTDQVVSIHKAMQENSCPVGQSRMFIGKFKAEENDVPFVINTVGPLYTEAEKERAAFLLQSCYNTAFILANLYQLSSIAFPAISCGANHFPPQEAAWTNYAQQINSEANATSSISIPTRSLTSTALSRYCVLCKNEQLPFDRQLLCLNCSELARSELFNVFLARLRMAAEKSYNELVLECKALKPILRSYPLSYNPVQRFDPTIHKRDVVAEYYLENHCTQEFKSSMPLVVVGDGNCFYNSFLRLVEAGSATHSLTLTAVELRARNIVELVLNINGYQAQYAHLSALLENFEDYVTKEMVRDSTHVSAWDLLSIPTVLNISIMCAYPKVNGDKDSYFLHINTAIFIALIDDNDDQEKKIEPLTSSATIEIKLLFSRSGRPGIYSKESQNGWKPNHFVPLLSLT
ncbi:hypothetical protein I4U23_008790 [Adineta vaga]|nr:hypothetical protein I4U23_008790 [Adineta vaga]